MDVIVPVALTVGDSPIEIFADGTSSSTITATVMSADVPLAGAVITFATTLGYVSPITATMDVSGTATVTLTSADVIGTATATATVDSSSNSVEVEFISLPKMFLPFICKQ